MAKFMKTRQKSQDEETEELDTEIEEEELSANFAVLKAPFEGGGVIAIDGEQYAVEDGKINIHEKHLQVAYSMGFTAV